MKDNSFDSAMKRIAVEDAALKAHREKQEARDRMKGRIVKGIVALALLGVLAAGWQYREPLQKWTSAHLQPAKPNIPDGAGAALKKLTEQAAKRDAALDALTAANATLTPLTNKASKDQAPPGL